MDMRNNHELHPVPMEHLGRTLALFWLLYALFKISFEVAILRAAQAPVPYQRLTFTTLVHSSIWVGVSWLLFHACDFALSRRRPFARRAAFLAAIAGACALRVVCYALMVGLLQRPPRLDGVSFTR